MDIRSFVVSPLSNYEEEIGRWLWCLEDVRSSLLEKLAGISQATLDARTGNNHSIGSLLYHIALIEADWLYVEVLGTEWEPEVRSLFPFECRSENGSLSQVEGQSLKEHLDRLNSVRQVFLSHFRSMTLTDWRNPRILENYTVTPEWVVYHLIEHEAHHRGQIFQLLSQLQ